MAFIIILIFAGCRPYRYKVTNKKAQIFQKSYTAVDTVFFENYILCNNLSTLFVNEKVEINEDSVMNIFFTSLEKSGVAFINKKGNNFCDDEFHNNRLMKFKKIRIERIKEISRPNNTLKVVPFIYIHNRSLKHLYIGSAGVPDGGGYLRDTFLNIMIYLIKNDEVVYLKSAWYGPVSSETATYNENPPKKLEQEHWDKLVELVLRDYLERLK